MDNGYEDTIDNYGKACFVGTFGKVYTKGDTISLEHGDGVRPLMLINISGSFYKSMTIKFGSYEQDNDLTNGLEEIEWWIIDECYENNEITKVLLLSKNILDIKRYNNTISKCEWKDCDLRKWLNKDFYNNSFNTNEKEFILETENNNKIFTSSFGEAMNGKTTKDKIFLLSYEEASKYLQLSYSRIAKYTNFTKNNLNLNNRLINHDVYWLRDSHNYIEEIDHKIQYSAHVVTSLGLYDSKFKNSYYGIRPAMWINMRTKFVN